MHIIFASHNEHKVEEIQKRLSSFHELSSLRAMGWEQEIPENGITLRENALIKARTVYEELGKPVLADDTGLEVDALEGAPGVYSARYAGLERNSEANMEKLLTEMKWIDDRSARFRTCLALIISGEAYIFEGIVEGKISHQRQGTGGFGYDPIFIPRGEERSFAEMSLGEKNKISHRARAMGKLMDFLAKLT
jgi:XTP/dITP diphosphohydrolase